ncbi:hypothetical protein MNEG_14771 [Monoraphidium neglectum]|uniref:Uncharacterized protein n=1 Tax=Monoraphidium neglectum TaxID=145388 RepID=A0A0D2MDA7_9CHLO|nr:hypothetical protein MNEG_14771 [Monoraphidium neglectum]KIY93190.1 hypothetical protein MNEG_14771 [Monoraphidium neglectum]|eukprot:XP_013892210.1 hypothetical protein MNEG_14771 [Monoraphidium neglectum]
MFALRAAAGLIHDWASANLDRVFWVFALYTAASCGILSLAKRLAKRLARVPLLPPPSTLRRWARRLRPRRRGAGAAAAAGVEALQECVEGFANRGLGGGKDPCDAWLRPLEGPVCFAADHLLPTQARSAGGSGGAGRAGAGRRGGGGLRAVCAGARAFGCVQQPRWRGHEGLSTAKQPGARSPHASP